LTTKIILSVDALGYLVRFILLPGQLHDSVDVEPLIERGGYGGTLVWPKSRTLMKNAE